MRAADLTDERFGRLTVIGRVENSAAGQARWQCLCDCGEYKIVAAKHLKSGAIKSCRCLNREIVTQHGHASSSKGVRPTSEYNSWFAMKNRCYNPNYHRFDRYGGRGIRVCDRWKDSFDVFLEDMGPKPESGFTIDRIDVDGDYEPANCRWLSQADNLRNMRGTMEN
jgi:hypothetical protein